MFGRKPQRSGGSVKDHWQALYARNAEEFEKILTDGTAWLHWDKSSMPESSAEEEFCTAIRILAGSDNWSLARRYLELSLAKVDRIVQEARLATFVDFPRNRGQMNRTKVYARSLLEHPWDGSALLDASRDYEEHCRKNYPGADDWHSQIQYYYVNSVHLALLGDDVERAGLLLRTPSHPLKYQKEHVKILEDLVRFVRDEMDENERQKFEAAYEAYFDRLRDPRIKQPGNSFRESFMCPLELGLLREKYIRHPGVSIDWRRVIADYSR